MKKLLVALSALLFCYLAWDNLVLLVTSTKFWLGIVETVIAFAIPGIIYEWAMRSRKKKK